MYLRMIAEPCLIPDLESNATSERRQSCHLFKTATLSIELPPRYPVPNKLTLSQTTKFSMEESKFCRLQFQNLMKMEESSPNW